MDYLIFRKNQRSEFSGQKSAVRDFFDFLVPAACFLLLTSCLLLLASFGAAKENPKAVSVVKEQGKQEKEEIEAPEKTITLISEGEVKVKAELGRVALHFTAYGWTVDKARKKADQHIQEFVRKLSQKKIVPSKIQIGEAKLKPSYQFNRDLKANVPSDFLVSRRILLEVEDLNALGKIMDISISIGSFMLEAVHLTVKDKTELGQKAFKKTLEEGQKKAEEIAKVLGLSVVGILNIEERSLEVEEINLIQETDFSLLAASSLKPKSKEENAEEEKASTGADKNSVQSREGVLAFSEQKERPEEGMNQAENSPQGDWVSARSKLKITYALR